jgi:predicted Zn-dependent protease
MKHQVALVAGLAATTMCPSWGSTSVLGPIEQDIKLGEQTAKQISPNPREYPILSESKHPEVYEYLNGIKQTILDSGAVKYAKDFAWQLHVINDPDTVNAFATPGGYIYIYTGLPHYLDGEDEIAGVLGHEIAHADLRHSTQQMQQERRRKILGRLGRGDKDALNQLLGLRHSRSDETEADRASVTYLCGTDYDAAGAAGFFEKLEAEGGREAPQFLSTHPSPDNRVEEIEEEARAQGCAGAEAYSDRYAEMLDALPGEAEKKRTRRRRRLPR